VSLRSPPNCRLNASNRAQTLTFGSYGFFNEALKTRSESRLAKLPASAFAKVPTVPRNAPKRAKVQPMPTSLMGPPDGESFEEPPPLPPSETEQLSLKAIGKLKAKEFDRVGKWEHMLQVSSRDPGGNISEWEWGHGVRGKLVGVTGHPSVICSRHLT
jgi:hypothetical protein